MILAAGVLVLLGLGLFVAGIVTGATLFYWLCVGACVAAGVLLVVARIRIGRSAGPPPPAAATQTTTAATTNPPASATAPATRQQPPSGATAASAVDPAPPAAPPPAVPEAGTAAPDPAPEEPSTAAQAPRGAQAAGKPPAGDPPVEEVEVTDLLLVVDLHDEVLVVDEHPRYHLAGCPWLAGRPTIPLPIDEARTDGFTPCAQCSPDRTLAERERGRRAGRAR